MEIKPKNIFYLSYDGILNALGESQILNYVSILSNFGKVNLLTFEKLSDLGNNFYLKIVSKKLKSNNIFWIRKKYFYNTFKFFHVIYIFFITIYYSIYFTINNKCIFHVRGYFPLFFLIIPSLFFKLKIIFDTRGFWHHEKKDRMGWKNNSISFIIINLLEKYFLKKCNYIICLTSDAKQHLSQYIDSKKIYVIPTCADTSKYTFLNNKENKNNKINLCYMGSTSNAYNFQKIIKIFSSLYKIDKNYNLFIFTNNQYSHIIDEIKKNNLNKKKIIFKNLNSDQIITELKHIDYGFFFLNCNFSVKATFPTKIAEYLSLGIPIICNNFNNDISKLINNNKIGYVYNNQSVYELDKFIKNNLNNIEMSVRCNKIAKDNLSLDYAYKIYKEIYNKL